MRMIRALRLSCVLLLIPLLLFGCVSVQPKQKDMQTKISSLSDAQAHLLVLDAFGGAYDHPELEAFVNTLLNRLVGAANLSQQTSYYVTLLDTPDINAFALPSGEIYLTRGLLSIANDTSEVAAILAHELAHLAADHSFKRQQHLEMLSRQNPKADKTSLSSLSALSAETETASIPSFSQFSRKQELEADEISIHLLARAGFDPYGALRFLKALQRMTAFKKPLSIMPEQTIFLSHPQTPKRIAFVQDITQRAFPNGFGRRGKAAYLKKIDGLVFGDAPGQGFFLGTHFIDQRAGIVIRFPSAYHLDRKDRNVVFGAKDAAHFIHFTQMSLPQTDALAENLKKGQIEMMPVSHRQKRHVNGHTFTTVQAKRQGWAFSIALIQSETAGFRLIFATKDQGSDQTQKDFEQTLASFKQLTPAQLSHLKPFVITRIRAKKGDTVKILAQTLRGIPPKARERFFRLLNHLPDDMVFLEPSRVYKSITGLSDAERARLFP